MSVTQITCPNCRFSKGVPTDRIPRDRTRVTCPKCREVFDFPTAGSYVRVPHPSVTAQGRAEDNEADATYVDFFSPDVVLSVEIDRKKQKLAIWLAALGGFSMVAAMFFQRNPPVALVLLFLPLALMLPCLRLFLGSNYMNPARQEAIAKLLLLARERVAKLLGQGEVVECCTVTQVANNASQQLLLLATNRRLLVVEYNQTWKKFGNCYQVGYDWINDLKVEGFATLGKSTGNSFLYLLKLEWPAGKPNKLVLGNADRHYLERVLAMLESHKGVGDVSGLTELCDLCARPLVKGICPSCCLKKQANLVPVLASLVWPGLGQFCNREPLKGAVFLGFSLLIVLTYYMQLKGVISGHQIASMKDKLILTKFLLVFGVVYMVTAVDAYLSSRKMQAAKN